MKSQPHWIVQILDEVNENYLLIHLCYKARMTLTFQLLEMETDWLEVDNTGINERKTFF